MLSKLVKALFILQPLVIKTEYFLVTITCLLCVRLLSSIEFYMLSILVSIELEW
jgi:hypothetical protein